MQFFRMLLGGFEGFGTARFAEPQHNYRLTFPGCTLVTAATMTGTVKPLNIVERMQSGNTRVRKAPIFLTCDEPQPKRRAVASQISRTFRAPRISQANQEVVVDGVEIFEIERIICTRYDKASKEPEWLVRWVGYGPSYDLWLRRNAFLNGVAIAEFNHPRPARLLIDAGIDTLLNEVLGA